MMPSVLRGDVGDVEIEELGQGRRRLTVSASSTGTFIRTTSCETTYPRPLIERILDVKGAAWLCDEIRREQDPSYVALLLEYAMLSYVDARAFEGQRLLDFGCGAGASTVVLSRMLPQTEIVGVELERDLLSIAELRAQHYGLANLRLVLSPAEARLPEGIGSFDFISFSAVFEHLLPSERHVLLPQLWSLLRPGGVFFLNQTPHRWFPVETHTTGLPLVNYLPSRAAHAVIRRLSKRVDPTASWEALLRQGIRGATEREVLDTLRDRDRDREPVVLRPRERGFGDQVDLWYAQSQELRPRPLKKRVRSALKVISRLTGSDFVPTLNMAVRKEPTTEGS